MKIRQILNLNEKSPNDWGNFSNILHLSTQVSQYSDSHYLKIICKTSYDAGIILFLFLKKLSISFVKNIILILKRYLLKLNVYILLYVRLE